MNEIDQMTSKILEALDQANGWIDEFEGIEGIGQGLKDGKDCIKVFVSRPLSEFADKIPKEVKGFAVVIEESGQFGIQ
jgi:hypothetical protein